MEDSSFGDGDILMTTDDTKLDDQPNGSSSILQEESMESLGEGCDRNEERDAAEKPSTSSLNLIKCYKRNRSRNYRTAADRSSSASSSSSSPVSSGIVVDGERHNSAVAAQDGDEEGQENAAEGSSSPISHRTYSIEGSPQRRDSNEVRNYLA